MDSEASVLETFDFLASENVDMDEDEDNLRLVAWFQSPFISLTTQVPDVKKQFFICSIIVVMKWMNGKMWKNDRKQD